MVALLTSRDVAPGAVIDVLRLRVAGVGMMRRHLMALAQAGVRRVVVEVPSVILTEVSEIAHADSPPGLTVQVVGAEHVSEAEPAERHAEMIIEQRLDTLFDPRLLAQLVRLASGGLAGVVCVDRAAGANDIEAKSPYKVGVPLRDEARPVDSEERSGLVPIGLTLVTPGPSGESEGALLDVGRYYWHRFRSAEDAQVATSKVLLATMKPTDGIYARTNRRVSLRISRALLNTPVTPNAITLATLACGVFAAWLISQGHYWPVVAGSLVGWFASMLDGVDGELARARFQVSPLGHWLEMVCDYIFYVALALGMGVGFTRVTGQQVWLALGIVAATGMLFTFGAVTRLKRTYARRGEVSDFYLAYQHSVRAPASSWFMRLTPDLTALVTRAAFPYYLVAFAVLGLAQVVLVIFAVSTQTFWLVALYASRGEIRDGSGRQAPLV